VSIDFDEAKQRWRVRWREEGRQMSRRFVTREEAAAFEEARQRDQLAPPEPAPPRGRTRSRLSGDGVYAYETKAGTRYRFVFWQSDGSQSNRRGFTSRRAAAKARRRLIESIERGEVKVARETFRTFWTTFLDERRAYLTKGSIADLESHARKRLLPAFGELQLARLDETAVRRWMAEMVKDVDAGRVSAKTINARTCLSVALNEACRRGLVPRNPCTNVRALPVERTELDYLRLDEIPQYLDACAPYYLLLARFLIGTGARISEALGLRFGDVDLHECVVRIHRQRDRDGDALKPTKGKRFRAVQSGPALAAAVREERDRRTATADDWLFLCPIPRRGQYSGRDVAAPPSRKTAHDWHEAALVDAGLRDMPLHALRHTAAAAWLATGHPLIFVQRQLGHRSITTTEEHYGHLELSFMREAVAETEARTPEPGWSRADKALRGRPLEAATRAARPPVRKRRRGRGVIL
jgi:integrase